MLVGVLIGTIFYKGSMIISIQIQAVRSVDIEMPFPVIYPMYTCVYVYMYYLYTYKNEYLT